MQEFLLCPNQSAIAGAFLFPGAGCLHAGYTVQNPVPLATWWLHDPGKEKPRYRIDSGVSFTELVPER